MEWDRGEALITAKGQREKPIYRRLVLEMREMKSSRLSGLSTAALNALTGSVLRFSMFLTKVLSHSSVFGSFLLNITAKVVYSKSQHLLHV